jgi:hypothetical protein
MLQPAQNPTGFFNYKPTQASAAFWPFFAENASTTHPRTVSSWLQTGIVRLWFYKSETEFGTRGCLKHLRHSDEKQIEFFHRKI